MSPLNTHAQVPATASQELPEAGLWVEVPAMARNTDLSHGGESVQETEEIWRQLSEARAAGNLGEQERLRNDLIERYYPLVKKVAGRLLQTLPKSVDLGDLISAGVFGLTDAIRMFDPSRGIKFKTYSSLRVRGAILDQLRSQDWVPRLVRVKATKIDKALRHLAGEYGREPTHAELASALEMDNRALTREISAAKATSVFSISESWSDGDDSGTAQLGDMLEDERATDPTSMMNKQDVMHCITRSLTEKERFIIEQYYRFGHTMRDIGEMLALTESRVCQIHTNVMARLREQLGPSEEMLMQAVS